MMNNFKTVLQSLEDTSSIRCIELFDADKRKVAEISNQEGSKGSVKIYHHLMKKFPVLDQAAAAYGLELFSEYVIEARNHPGKHQNIDRLIEIEHNNKLLYIRAILN